MNLQSALSVLVLNTHVHVWVTNPHTCAFTTLSILTLHWEFDLVKLMLEYFSHTPNVEECTLARNMQMKQLSTTDLLALASMKNAAKCDK